MEIRAATLSLKELSPALDKAVDAAATRTGIKVEGQNQFYPKWELIGRRLMEAELASAREFSSQVAKDMASRGIKAEPAALVLNDVILAGWFPVDSVNPMRF